MDITIPDNFNDITLFHRFASDRIDSGLGFMIKYESDDVGGKTVRLGCGGNLTTKSGLLASPSFPEAYPEDQSCIYTISVPDRHFINITFLALDISCSVQVGSDYTDAIEIRDGTSGSSPLMMEYCGNGSHIPTTMQSTQNFIWIK